MLSSCEIFSAAFNYFWLTFFLALRTANWSSVEPSLLFPESLSAAAAAAPRAFCLLTHLLSLTNEPPFLSVPYSGTCAQRPPEYLCVYVGNAVQ